MREAPVKTDNHLVWDGTQSPFLELYSVHIPDTNGNWALWLEYGLTVPTAGNQGTATVRAVFASRNTNAPNEPPLILCEEFDMGVHDVVHAEHFIQIASNNLSLGECIGSLTAGRDVIKWEFAFEDPVESVRPCSSMIFRATPAQNTLKTFAPRSLGFATGTLFINHRKISLTRQRIYQNHVFGGLPHGSFAWAHCGNFTEDSLVTFDAFSGPIALGHIRGTFHSLAIRYAGERFYANSAQSLLFYNRSEWNADGWQAEFEKNGCRFEIMLRRDPEFQSSWQGAQSCQLMWNLSSLAKMELRVLRRHKGVWQIRETLQSSTALFQTLIIENAENQPGLSAQKSGTD